MSCPVCTGEPIPSDVSMIDEKGQRVIVQGKVYAIIPAGYTYSPYRDYATITLYPRKGKVKYLKFKTEQELAKWAFEKDDTYVVLGCLHIADGKELVFDIKPAEAISS